MKKYLSISLLLLISSCTCKKENINYQISCDKPSNEIDISKNLFQGKWVWVSEYYVQPFTSNVFYKTPTTEGYTKQLLVYDNSILEFYKNDTASQKYKYDFVQEKSITNYTYDTTNVLVFKDFLTGIRSKYVHYKICNDTLTLNYQITTDYIGQQKWSKTK